MKAAQQQKVKIYRINVIGKKDWKNAQQRGKVEKGKA